ncbi:GMC oxred N domain containing protein [Asbolus verrucosus]|uniref:GMC oxred N domain containing protein n=1 Tax=Asbolus verrucosus TaxID=1661398 RepID=A0A482VSA0_ASBVE|nr:GMC oxred N domain containing protein [Asbolus verrucosus]
MEHQEGVCRAMEEQKCAWPRGKALGGSTVINYNIYTRGNPKDYDKWAEQGNDGWSYDEVLPYFLKSENCNLGIKLCSTRYHNNNGYLHVQYPFKSEITEAFLEAGTQLGEKIVDYNTPDFMGFSQIQATLRNGRRHSTADAFIYPVKDSRTNLKILTSARVTKILIDPLNKQAYGVVFRRRGKQFIAKARKEVILSAGAFGSPQLLMLSGIGPQEHLKQLNIPLVKNLPVGQLLYDHIGFLGLAFKINQTIEPREAIFDPREIFKWAFEGRGVFTSLGGVEALAYVNVGSIPDRNYPDTELVFVGCEIHKFDSDDYWKCALRSLSSTLHHQIGTCKMGLRSDSEAVVNSRLKVHDIEGLRVADSSIIPVTLSGHTSAPSIMIGEKASDIIKKDWDVSKRYA